MLFPNRLASELKFFPKRHASIMLGIAMVLFITGIFLPSLFTDQKKIISLPLNGRALLPQEKPEEASSPSLTWKEQQVKPGDNLARIFKRVGEPSRTLANLIDSSPDKKIFRSLMPGETFRFGFEKGSLKKIQYLINPLETVDVLIEGPRFSFEHITKQPDIRLAYKKVTVKDSLFLSAMRANLNDNITMEIANIFGGVIDFALDVRTGDHFDVLYETRYLDDKMIDLGDILAVSYTNNGKTHTAFRYTMENGKSGYFDAEGNSMRKAFLRAPLDFTRISSGFNLKRKHPIHKKIKAHRGIDYAAPKGTPIFAAGDGRVTRSGYTRANGNYVVIQHGQKYTTKYLHLTKRYVKTNKRVKQREIIGTVGSTGYATGPHLHYEFLVNGVHRNPRTILKKLPSAEPIPATEKKRFLEKVKSINLQYENHQSQG